uniref:Matrix remodeling associated 5 n=1 Tax=Oncorhynchus kisutch TaxID=8019 RepID=A0A8C7I847_ONCKI
MFCPLSFCILCLSNLVVSYGAALKVDCLATGQPNPAVRWSLPDGTSVKSVLLQVEESGRRSRRLVVFDNGTLFLPSVGMGEEGEYVCHAENHGGRDTMSVMVKVLASPPSFPSTKYEVIKVQQGGAVALNCGAKGEPVPTITWLSPMNRVLPVEASGPVVVQQDGSLVIQGARGADGGNYTCRASNAAGERSKVMGVEVMVTPPSFTLNGAGGGINGADRQIAVVSGSGLSHPSSINKVSTQTIPGFKSISSQNTSCNRTHSALYHNLYVYVNLPYLSCCIVVGHRTAPVIVLWSLRGLQPSVSAALCVCSSLCLQLSVSAALCVCSSLCLQLSVSAALCVCSSPTLQPRPLFQS